MGKYSSVQKKEVIRDRSPHAIWRGIGCFMFILVPILSIAVGVEAVDYALANKIRLPYQLLGYPAMPDFLRQSNLIWNALAPIRTTSNFYAYAAAAVVALVLLGGLISVVYAFVYQITGPKRYGPTDAPPIKIKGMKKKSR
ncbi:MAG: hypothetical protein IT310_01930 [Anaerolineales bacterium]|nr:hypothetical protein [Anaerolineales bacterium]